MLLGCDFSTLLDDAEVENIYLNCESIRFRETEKNFDEDNNRIIKDSSEESNLKLKNFYFAITKYRAGVLSQHKYGNYYYTVYEVSKFGDIGSTWNVIPKSKENFTEIKEISNGYRAVQEKDKVNLRVNWETVTINEISIEAFYSDTYYDKEVFIKKSPKSSDEVPIQFSNKLTISKVNNSFSLHKQVNKSPEKDKWNYHGFHYYGACKVLEGINFKKNF